MNDNGIINLVRFVISCRVEGSVLPFQIMDSNLVPTDTDPDRYLEAWRRCQPAEGYDAIVDVVDARTKP